MLDRPMALSWRLGEQKAHEPSGKAKMMICGHSGMKRVQSARMRRNVSVPHPSALFKAVAQGVKRVAPLSSVVFPLTSRSLPVFIGGRAGGSPHEKK